MRAEQRYIKAPALNFEVTAEHIATAVPKDSGHCMIADALAAAMPQATYVSVDLATIRWTDEAAGLRYIYLTPGRAQRALIAFDQGEKPEPFRVRAQAAQIVLTGAARRRRSAQYAEAKERSGKRPFQQAFLATPSHGTADSSVPVKVGGETLPKGALQGGTAKRQDEPARQQQRGKRREFGLRRFVQ